MTGAQRRGCAPSRNHRPRYRGRKRNNKAVLLRDTYHLVVSDRCVGNRQPSHLFALHCIMSWPAFFGLTRKHFMSWFIHGVSPSEMSGAHISMAVGGTVVALGLESAECLENEFAFLGVHNVERDFCDVCSSEFGLDV